MEGNGEAATGVVVEEENAVGKTTGDGASWMDDDEEEVDGTGENSKVEGKG